jgi:hypothetical protein
VPDHPVNGLIGVFPFPAPTKDIFARRREQVLDENDCQFYSCQQERIEQRRSPGRAGSGEDLKELHKVEWNQYVEASDPVPTGRFEPGLSREGLL